MTALDLTPITVPTEPDDDLEHIECCHGPLLCGAPPDNRPEIVGWTMDDINCPICRLVIEENDPIEAVAGCLWCPLRHEPCPKDSVG